MKSVTETKNMDESNDTNLKPILPILFFLKAYEYRLGNSTKSGLLA
jgi:hypothetical protein